MPSYNTSSTATALGISQKWLDNLLSHNKIEGVYQAKQGVARRLSMEAITTIAVTYQLTESIGLPVAQAVRLAEQLFASPDNSVVLSDAITLAIDRTQVELSVSQRLAHAVEVTPIPARGRPLLPPSTG
jgi:hypothetical protein